MILANDLHEKQTYEIILQPGPFSECLSCLDFVEAMDFIEDYIVNNGFIPDELKLKLLYAEELAPYSFIGALFHFANAP